MLYGLDILESATFCFLDLQYRRKQARSTGQQVNIKDILTLICKGIARAHPENVGYGMILLYEFLNSCFN